MSQEKEELRSLIERLPKWADDIKTKLSRATAQVGYIKDAVDQYAQGYQAIIEQSSDSEDVVATIVSGVQVGESLRVSMETLETETDNFSTVVSGLLPTFSTASSGAVTVFNSFRPDSPPLKYQPCPFLPSSDEEKYATKLLAYEEALGRVYRAAWTCFYAEANDPGRTAFWELRQVYDHLFELLAPDELVRQSSYWKVKDGSDRNAIHREERLTFAVYHWIDDEQLKHVMLSTIKTTKVTYGRLNAAHKRGKLSPQSARETFLAMDEILRRWVDAIHPWPPLSSRDG